MEKNTLMNLSVRNSQLASFVLFNLSGLTAIILTLLGLAGVLTANEKGSARQDPDRDRAWHPRELG